MDIYIYIYMAIYAILYTFLYILYIYIYSLYVYIYIWRFPEMGVPPNHPKLDHLSIETYGSI